jgi:hypothetical protein
MESWARLIEGRHGFLEGLTPDQQPELPPELQNAMNSPRSEPSDVIISGTRLSPRQVQRIEELIQAQNLVMMEVAEIPVTMEELNAESTMPINTRPMTVAEYVRNGRPIPEEPIPPSNNVRMTQNDTYQFNTAMEVTHDPQFQYSPDFINTNDLEVQGSVQSASGGTLERVPATKKRLKPRVRALPA